MRIDSRLKQLEKEIDKVSSKSRYLSIISLDESGVGWFLDRHGNRVQAGHVDKDLMPKNTIIVLDMLQKSYGSRVAG
jgi:hypothetical protein